MAKDTIPLRAGCLPVGCATTSLLLAALGVSGILLDVGRRDNMMFGRWLLAIGVVLWALVIAAEVLHRLQSRATPIRFTLRSILVVMALIAFAFGVGYRLRLALGPIKPNAALAKLRPGMGHSEVEAILGRPTRVDTYGNWVYEKPFNPGWLTINFDKQSKLTDYDHEPVIP
jgi:hypothetical protein